MTTYVPRATPPKSSWWTDVPRKDWAKITKREASRMTPLPTVNTTYLQHLISDSEHTLKLPPRKDSDT